jgi:hypothetical protein
MIASIGVSVCDPTHIRAVDMQVCVEGNADGCR